MKFTRSLRIIFILLGFIMKRTLETRAAKVRFFHGDIEKIIFHFKQYMYESTIRNSNPELYKASHLILEKLMKEALETRNELRKGFLYLRPG